ncbi:unnamed protein product, partial [Soboliphyme baturini]|uniref:Secreted protein n=1 Tax=Soboliphyme baturini TaxID=241478 RepID=A0A183J7Q1_9BILA
MPSTACALFVIVSVLLNVLAVKSVNISAGNSQKPRSNFFAGYGAPPQAAYGQVASVHSLPHGYSPQVGLEVTASPPAVYSQHHSKNPAGGKFEMTNPFQTNTINVLMATVADGCGGRIQQAGCEPSPTNVESPVETNVESTRPVEEPKYYGSQHYGSSPYAGHVPQQNIQPSQAKPSVVSMQIFPATEQQYTAMKPHQPQ